MKLSMTKDAFKQVEQELKDIELAVLGLVAISFSDFLSREYIEGLVQALREVGLSRITAKKVIEETGLDTIADTATDVAFDKIEREIGRRAFRYATVLNRSMRQPLSRDELRDLVRKVVGKIIDGEVTISVPKPMTASRSESLALPKEERRRIEEEYLESIQTEEGYLEAVILKKMESLERMRKKYKQYARNVIIGAILVVLSRYRRKKKAFEGMTDDQVNRWLTNEFQSEFKNIFSKISKPHRPLTLPDKARSIASFMAARFVNELNREMIIASGARFAYYRTQRDSHVCEKCFTLENTIDESVAEELKGTGINTVGLYRINDERLREQHPVPRLRCYFVPIYI